MRYSFQALLSTAGIAATIAIALATTASQGQSVNVRVFADPEVRISYDGDVPHMEAPIAASATDPNTIYAAAELLYPGRNVQTAAQVYTSHDAGVQWSALPLPIEAANESWDNALAGGYGQNAYFITRDYKRGLTTYRTNDGGKTWIPALVVHPHSDREYAVVDTTGSRFSGRLYIAEEGFADPWSGTYKNPKQFQRVRMQHHDGVIVISSKDGGKTFNPAALACYRPGLSGKAFPSPVVLSDGTLVVLCSFYLGQLNMSVPFQNMALGVAVSSDGGKTFSSYRGVGRSMRITSELTHEINLDKGDWVANVQASMAASPKSGRYSNRIYIAWPNFDTPSREVMYMVHSDDQGRTWSRPLAVYPVVSSKNGLIREAVPMLAVNKDGVVGLAWYDARDAAGAHGFDIYFAASTDGGATFTTPVRLTSATWMPQLGGGNNVPHPMVLDATATGSQARDRNAGVYGSPTTIQMLFVAPFASRNIGGDYAAMTVDAGGRFHPLWPDAPDGKSWQLYTSTIRVMPDAQYSELIASAQDSRSCDLTNRVHIVLGVPTWDEAAQEMTMAVQFENLSNHLLINPLHVHVDEGPSLGEGAVAKRWPPAPVYDARTGKFTKSTDFLYPVSTEVPLFPFGVTKPLTWRFHVTSSDARAYFQPVVTVRSAACSSEH